MENELDLLSPVSFAVHFLTTHVKPAYAIIVRINPAMDRDNPT